MTDPNSTGQRPPVDAQTNMAPPPPPAYFPPYPSYAPPAKPSVIGKVLMGAFVSLFIVSVLANVYLFQFIKLLTGGLREIEYQEGDESQRIVVIPIEGIINEAQFDFVGAAFKYLRETPNPPKAVVLRVDSPGGGVGASDRIFNEVKRFKKERPGIPVLASYGSVAASGGYYVSVGCDYIMAEPTCINGSIGVIWQSFTVEKLMEKIGVKGQVHVADGSPRKDVANNLFRDYNEEDIAKVKATVNFMHDRFVAVVTEGRGQKMTEAEIKAAANGDTYNTKQAIEKKLIDGEGYLEDLLTQAKTMAKISGEPQVTVISLPRGFSIMSLLGKSSDDSTMRLDGDQIRTLIHEVSAPRLEYLWSPGR